MRKPAFCIICENKRRSNREADQRLCFRYIDSVIPLLSKSDISSFYQSSVTVQTGLCRTWSETPKTGFLTTRLIYTCTICSKSVYEKQHYTGYMTAHHIITLCHMTVQNAKTSFSFKSNFIRPHAFQQLLDIFQSIWQYLKHLISFISILTGICFHFLFHCFKK